MNDYRHLSNQQLIEILAYAPKATAVYTTVDMIIQSANNAMLAFWGKDQRIIGLPFEEAIPELKGQPFLNQLREVLLTGESFIGHALPAEFLVDGELKVFYYDYKYIAIKNEQGETYAVLHTAKDVTELVLSREALEKAKAQEEELEREHILNEQLAAANEELNAINEELKQAQESLYTLNNELEQRVEERTRALAKSESGLRSLVVNAHYALMVLRGKDWIIEVVNQPLVNLWDRKIEDVTGRPLMEIMNEIESQSVPVFLKQVYETGIPIGQEEHVFHYNSPAGPAKKYVSFHYDPILDDHNEVSGIIVAAEDVTEKVRSRLLLEESYKNQQDLIEELSSINEELAAANDDLVDANNALADTKESLQATIDRLGESEASIRYMLEDAPVAIAIFKGRDMIIESANNKVLEAWGKTTDVIGKPIAVAIPELAGQAFFQLLDDVYTSGVPFYGKEVLALLEQNNSLEEVYSDFVYHPIKNEEGKTTNIMLVAHVITDQVLARKKVEQTEEMLRVCIEAANAGTWYLDVETREFSASDRLKELFGFEPNYNMTYDDAIATIPEEYRERITEAVERSIYEGVDYSMEHTLGKEGQEQRWVRAMGKRYQQTDGSAHFSGLMLDITEQKKDEIRKNDFIGMVSHELKTPLTSLTGYMQLLQRKAKKTEDEFATEALGKVDTQLKKMTAMINGFLNVSRLESGKIFLQKHKFELDELVQDTIEESRLSFFNYSIKLIPCSPVKVCADRDKIGSVISNLLSNAVKYSPNHHEVIVRCEVIGNLAQISVHDQGIGIDPKDAMRLFQRFYRIENKSNPHISGFGIGLYLSAEIVQHHGGQIWVESVPDVGSSFYFTLPLSDACSSTG